MQHAYAVTNLAAALADAAFTWGTGATTNRSWLRDGRIDRVFAAGSASGGTTLVLDFGSAVSLSAIAVLNSNIAQATSPTLKVEGADDSGFSVNAVERKAASSLNATAPRHKDHILQFSALSRRYWRLTWTWTGSFALTVGEVFAAATTSLSRAQTYGLEEREEYFGTRHHADAGGSWANYLAGPERVLDIVWEDLSTEERDELRAMFRATRGGHLPLLWVPAYEVGPSAAPGSAQDVVYGHFEEETFGATEFDFERYNPGALTLRGLGREVGA